MQTEYKITWTINVTGENPLDAAKQALALFKAEDSTATIFRVENPQGATTEIDLHLQTETVVKTLSTVIAIIMDGGVVQEIISNNTDNSPDCIVIDYDTNGYEEEDLSKIPQRDGSFSHAHVHDRIIEAADIDLPLICTYCF